jgi:tRNA dimethylallyltransferase
VLPADAILIAGPTAVGKSEIAFRLAEVMGGEIISVDSMQVYRGMDLGTAKPSEQQRKQIPHHLIDVADTQEAFDAAQFVKLARRAATEIVARGRLPILCGGTGLYFKALLEGLGDTPPGDDVLRRELERMPLEELTQELAQTDPLMYERIDRKNKRRVVRAVEVIRLTGKPYSSLRANWDRNPPQPQAKQKFLCLNRPSTDLHHRIDLRVEQMFEKGLIAETEALLPRGLAQNRAAMQALGYRQVIEYLQGQRSLPDTIALVKIRTRQFAKRQMTWFKKQRALQWVQLGNDAETNFSQVRHLLR